MRELRVKVLTYADFEVGKASDKPRLSDFVLDKDFIIAESLAMRADMIIYVPPDTNPQDNCTMHVLKNRMGAAGIYKLQKEDK